MKKVTRMDLTRGSKHYLKRILTLWVMTRDEVFSNGVPSGTVFQIGLMTSPSHK